MGSSQSTNEPHTPSPINQPLGDCYQHTLTQKNECDGLRWEIVKDGYCAGKYDARFYLEGEYYWENVDQAECKNNQLEWKETDYSTIGTCKKIWHPGIRPSECTGGNWEYYTKSDPCKSEDQIDCVGVCLGVKETTQNECKGTWENRI